MAQYNEEIGDPQEAAKWYLKAAEKGYLNAMYNIAVCYESGYGTTQNVGEAMAWYLKAAEQDHTQAQYNLALCHLKSHTQNYDEVFK